LGSTIEQTTQKIVENHARARFTTTWTLISIVEMGDCFHHDFQVGLQVDLCKNMGLNLGYTTWAQ